MPPASNLKVPTSETVWLQQGSDSLGVGRPVTLVWQNGQGLEFRRTISVDDKYLFSIRDEVANSGAAAVTLAPYALISRHSPPPALGYYLLHEGAIGVLGDQGLQEVTYKTLDDKKRVAFRPSNAWLGFTDKYWAAILLPETSSRLQAEFSASSLGYAEDLSGRLCAGCADHRAGRHRKRHCPAVCRRQGSRDPRRLRQGAQAQSVRPCDRLGLVPLHHQADVHADRHHLSAGRKFWRRDPDGDADAQGRILSARQ